MDIKLVKRIANPNNKPILKKADTIEELEQPHKESNAQLTPKPTVDATVPPQPTVTSPTFFVNDSDDISARLQISVGNSGWQPSDIWRDIRIDSFYD